MTPTWLKRAAYGLVGLCLATVISLQSSSKGTSAAVRPNAPMPTATPKPTASRYNCGDTDHPDYIYLDWPTPMPHGGWLGNVVYGSNKPAVQIFNSQPVEQNVTDWTYQAQDGSFICHMIVSNKPPLTEHYVSFERCNNNKWPQVTCYLR